MNTPIFEAVAAEHPGIHRTSNRIPFPKPAPEPYISFIKERGAWWKMFTPSNAKELWP